MQKIRRSFLLATLFAFLLFSGITSIALAQEGNPHETGRQFDQLSTFLKEMGYEAEEGEVIRSQINDVTFNDDIEVAVHISVRLFPFVKDDGSRATIAAWRGRWDQDFYKGAVATLNETEMYGVMDGSVQKIENIESYLEFPLYALAGPNPPGTSSVTEAENTEPITLSTSCTTVHREATAYSYLGSKMYSYAMDKYFCFNGSTVFNINVNAYLAYSDGIHSYLGTVGSTDYYKNGNTSHYSFRQAHIRKCVVQYGCIADMYPWIEIEGYYNGYVTSYTNKGF